MKLIVILIALTLSACAGPQRPFTACDMARATYASPHRDTHRLGASWFEAGACQ